MMKLGIIRDFLWSFLRVEIPTMMKLSIIRDFLWSFLQVESCQLMQFPKFTACFADVVRHSFSFCLS